MDRRNIITLVLGVCSLFATGLQGQTQKSVGVQDAEAALTVSSPVEPDSPGSSTAVAVESQAKGASPGTIVPRLMKFSGALHDAAGKPLTGAVDVTFSLYSTESGGDALWFETQSVQADDLGRYTALLGAMHTDGLPVDLFTSGEARWLGIQVGVEAEQQPRVLLVSVPYALKAGDAETLGGKPASAYVLADAQSGTGTGTATTSTANASQAGTKGATEKGGKTNVSPLVAVCSSITSNAGGTANSIPMFTAQCNIENSVITQSGGNVGIGTSTPQFKLDILDNNTNATGFRVTNPNSGTSAQIQTQLKNDVGGLAINGITSSTFTGGGSINGGNAFWTSDFTDAVFGSLGLNNIIFTQNRGETARFDTSGRLGIGTSAPQFKLDILDNNTNGTGFRVTNPNSGTSAQVQTQLKNDVGGLAINGITSSTFTGGGSINGGNAFWISDFTDAVFGSLGSNNIIFTQNRGETARFDTSGRLGIGTPSPAARLDVNGTANFSGLVTFAPGQNFGSSTSMVTGSTGTFTANTANQVLNVTQTSTGAAAVLNNTTGGNILVGQNNGTQKFAVDGSGNVTLSGGLNLPETTGPGVGVISSAGQRFIHACCGNIAGNTFVGIGAGNFSTTGTGNSAFGYAALIANTTGNVNTASGEFALGSNTTGLHNTATGVEALFLNDTANQDAALGSCALTNTFGTAFMGTINCRGLGLTAGSGNTAVGFTAGQTNTTGEANTFLGYQADASSGTLTNATAIGANAVVGESNALVLGGTGASAVNVGIGIQSPVAALDVEAATTNSNNNTALFADTAIGPNVSHIHYGTTGDWYIRSASGSGKVVIQDSGGNVGIGTSSPDATLSVNGTADKTGGGSWTTFSDARLKTIDGSFQSGLAQVLKLNPIVYRYKDDNAMAISDHAPHVGLVAQEVQRVIPEAVTANTKGYLLVNNDPIIWAMLNAIKEQQTQIQQMRRAAGEKDAEVAKFAHATAAKDAQVATMTREIEQLRKAQEQMAVVVARLAHQQPGQTRVARASSKVRTAAKTKKAARTEIARVGF